ncbi:MAG: CoA ester lyase [Streptosporangiales bacterium]|nr:CoA ester lyase [Streptosporangiales bacterium]
MTAVHRSWLYVPGTRPDRFAAAAASGADAVVVDLEDAVPVAAKATAREAAATHVHAANPAVVPIYVRINHPRTPWARADVTALAGPGLAGVRIPKVENPEEIQDVAGWLRGLGAAVPLYCLIESALGVERAFDLAGADPLVAGIALGEADLAADLGTGDDDGLRYARSRCVVAARAAGLPPPVQAVFPNVHDLDGLRASCVQGRRLGFLGRSAIHPRQVPVINTAYTPTGSEVADARALVESAERRENEPFVLADGRFVDAAVAEHARRTLELARRPSVPADDTSDEELLS